jgi:uncharacterized membrane protein
MLFAIFLIFYVGEIMKYLIFAAIGSAMYGFCIVLLKNLISELSLQLLILNPLFLFINITFGGMGFVLNQISIKKEKASHVWLVSNFAGAVVVILSSFMILKESMSVSEMIGFFLMIIASLLLIKKIK